MASLNELRLAESLWQVHDSATDFLDHTRLGYAFHWRLLLLIMASEKDPQLSLKSLNADGFAATSALRRVVRRLEKEGWLMSDTHPDDSRVRVIKPTPKLHDHVHQYLKMMDDCMSKLGLEVSPVANSHE